MRPNYLLFGLLIRCYYSVYQTIRCVLCCNYAWSLQLIIYQSFFETQKLWVSHPLRNPINFLTSFVMPSARRDSSQLIGWIDVFEDELIKAFSGSGKRFICFFVVRCSPCTGKHRPKFLSVHHYLSPLIFHPSKSRYNDRNNRIHWISIFFIVSRTKPTGILSGPLFFTKFITRRCDWSTMLL